MKVMIDIPEETYNKMRRGEKLYPADANVAIFAIETGTPLSESEDCVSRQDAINIVVCDILSSAIVYGRTEEGMAAKKAIVDGLKRLPSVTPAENPFADAKKYFDAIHNLSQTCDLPYSFVKDEIEEIMKRLKGLGKQTFEGMTNGEVMQAVFPKAEVEIYIDEYERPYEYLMRIDDETYFTKEWWNAPYKGGAE